MRFLFLILLIFPLFVLAEPGKVVGVIPVKFNSKGMHAPVPYNQQLMQRGWTRVPTLNLPFTYAGGAGQNPRYQPTKVTKKSFARALGYAAGRAANMTPAGKALLIAYGAYEANCITENYPSLCVGEEFDPATANPLDGVEAQKTTSCQPKIIYAAVPDSRKEAQNQDYERWKENIAKENNSTCPPSNSSLRYDSCSASLQMKYSYPACGSTDPVALTRVIKYSTSTSSWDSWAPGGGAWKSNPPYSQTNSYDSVFRVVEWHQKEKPECTNPQFPNGPLSINGKDYCFPNTKNIPVTPEWIEEQDAKDPAKLPNSDVGLDDFVDWETGLPRPDAFEEPTYDPVSPAFADAAEAIANGTVQHDNPNAPGYVPREMMPNLLVQINNWHEGNTFIDVFSGKEVKPDAPPPEESKIDWSKFPGITKAQYEASNNAWGKSAADQAPNINDEISKGEEEFTKLKETINDVPDKTPFVMDFADLVIFPSGGCKGFTVAASLAGQPKSIIVDKHCPPYDAWGRGFIEWILFVATAFQIFHIFRRTLEVV